MIIVLNATDLTVEEKQWNVEDATRFLMSDIEGAISRVPRFQEYANLWRDTGRTIRTTKDLLECYYSSITVVRIPTHGRYMLMNQQISKLHGEIKKCCQVSYWTKKRVRMLSSDEKLQVFLQSAFDHFSQNLNSPFDFVKEAVKNNLIPRDFGGNILKLAIAVRDYNCFIEQYDGQKIWLEMSQMVASCLMLNSARQSLLGKRRHSLYSKHTLTFSKAQSYNYLTMSMQTSAMKPLSTSASHVASATSTAAAVI
jgi:hypothetical protein